jgi:uncharacterized membrane protein
MLGTAIDIFSKADFAYLSRWGHVVVGIAWIGLLYYFNFVQVPAFAEMEAAARNNAIDKLASRALWWFRWAAVATFVTGLLIIGFQPKPGDYFKQGWESVAIGTGILFGVTMLLNVWGVIWRNQKLVIANARNVQAGGEADPAAADAGRRALLASRQNAIFSLPLLVFMVGTAHFAWKNGVGSSSAGTYALYWIVTVAIWGVLEANALGLIGGLKPGGTNVIYDTHKNALITGFCYAAFMFLFFALVLN